MSLDISYGPKPRTHAGRKTYYVGVDGEGFGRFPHRYTLLAWSDEHQDKHEYVENYQDGLSTRACLEFLLSMPNPAKAFSYAFNYDMTKILTDLPNKLLYELFRPDLRRRPKNSQVFGPLPVLWTAPPEGDEPEKQYALNLQGTKLTISDLSTKRKRVIWDVFKFFQANFAILAHSSKQ